MELVLTSFGLSHLSSQSYEREWTIDHSLGLYGMPDFFDRMPPVSMSRANRHLLPDYAALLMCERLILDAGSWDRISNRHYHDGYSEVAETLRILHSEGFVRVEDFESIVAANHDLLAQMLDYDLKHVEDWIAPLKESVATWQTFAESLSISMSQGQSDSLQNMLQHTNNLPAEQLFQRAAMISATGDLHNVHSMAKDKLQEYTILEDALESSKKRRYAKYRNAIKQHLAGYLSLVNANLVLSHALDAGFHDWHDFAPFYRHKLLGIGQRERPEESKTEKASQLFQLFFPELAYWNTKDFIRVLKDKRIQNLRSFVDTAVRDDIQFDQDFAIRTLQEVLRIENRASRARQFVSYLTLPIALIPGMLPLVDTLVEESVGRVVEKRAKKDFRWFYLISEVAAQNQSGK